MGNPVLAAVAEQEEHLKRQASCLGVRGMGHSYRPHGKPGTNIRFSRCIVCQVTETQADYKNLLEANSSLSQINGG